MYAYRFVLFFLAAAFLSCLPGETPAREEFTAATTLAVMADMARAVAGDANDR